MTRIPLVRRTICIAIPTALACLAFARHSPAAADVIITEINYNISGDDRPREFVEIKNAGDETALMTGWRFTQGITFNFPAGTTLAPGDFIVLVANTAQFQANYGAGIAFGQYGNDDAGGVTDNGALDNSDERITLEDDMDNEVFSVKYWDGKGAPDVGADADDFERERWPESPDGDGYTLVSLDPNDNPDPDDYRNWRPSIDINGSPGADEPLPDPLQRIYVNEIRTRDGILDNDAVELYNPGEAPVDISNWFVSDNIDNPKKSPVPAGTVVPAGGYVVVENSVSGFLLSVSSKGERAFLYSADSGGALSGWVHGYHTEASADGKTFARFIAEDGREYLIQDDPSLGADNGLPATPQVVISEINYSPGFGADVEYLKIKNISDSPALLYDALAPADNLSIGGFGVTIPGVRPTLAAGEEAFVVAVPEAQFRSAYQVDGAARVFADPMGGSLSGGGELLELRLPVTIDGEGRSEPTNPASGRFYNTLDEVRYNDSNPWPLGADGGGYSIQKVVPGDPGHEPASWALSPERGGSAYGGEVVYVNEVLSHTDLPQTDVIELFNPNDSDVDIGGWFLTDDPLVPNKYTIPAGTTIRADGFWAVNEDNDDNPGAPASYFGNAFQISSRGDEVYLFSTVGGTTTGFAHGADFRATQNGVSVIRHVNSAGAESFPPQSGGPSLEVNRFKAFPEGATNAAPRVERAVISEIFYDPPAGHVEFVEIANISGGTLALYDTTQVEDGGNPNNNWALDGVNDPVNLGELYILPGVRPTLAVGERIVVTPVGTDVEIFRASYGIPGGVTIIGGADGFGGALNNAGEEVALLRPDKPDDVPGEGTVVPMIQVDSITYDDRGPWPAAGGKSIERIADSEFGDEPSNWKVTAANFATPGTGPVAESGYDAWAAAQFSVEELNGPGTAPVDDFNGDGYSNLFAYAFGYSPKAPVDGSLFPVATIIDNSGADTLAISFRQQVDAADLSYRVQRSHVLGAWEDIDNALAPPVDNGDGTQTVTHGDLAPIEDFENSFLRVWVEFVSP